MSEAAKGPTCETCTAWQKVGASPTARRIVYDTGVKIIPPGDEGECHVGPPREDFRWPLTHANHTCACHQSIAPARPDDALGRLEQELESERVSAHQSGEGHNGDGAPSAAVDAEAARSTATQTETPAPVVPAREPAGTGKPADTSRSVLRRILPGRNRR